MRQLKDTENRDKYKVYGELINAYGYNVPEGAKQMEALNYYTNETVTNPVRSNKHSAGKRTAFLPNTTNKNVL